MWIQVKDPRIDLPIDGTVFLSIWKGRICLTQWCDEDKRFFISFDPAEYEASWMVDSEREGKFTHWMKLPKEP